MRHVALVLGVCAIASLAPRAVEACSWDPCYFEPRWTDIELYTLSPAPRDGAFVFQARTGVPTCLAELAPHLSISVSLRGVPVPGALAQLEGLPNMIVWRPTALLAANAVYAIRVVVDNDALGPDNGDGFEGTCASSRLAETYTVTTSAALTELPPLPPPTVEARTFALDQDLGGVVCCPSVVPTYSDPGGCSYYVNWEYSGGLDGCAYLYEYTTLTFTGAGHDLAPALGRQVVYQIVVDGVVVERGLDPAIAVNRNTAGCARMEALHLGTEAVLASAETCPSAADVAALGPHALDAAGTLGCDQGVLCSGENGWSEPCVAFDPQDPPPPTALPSDDPLDLLCPAAVVPGVPFAGGDPGVDRGCGCRSATIDASLWLLLGGGLLGRRRRRRG